MSSLATRLFDCPRPLWASMNESTLTEALLGSDIWTLVVEGLMQSDAIKVDTDLRQTEGYLGAIEVYLANRVHWALYDKQLLAVYRVLGDELRMLATSEALDPGGRDEGMFLEWGQSGIFQNVEWEDIGLRGTVFDELSEFDRARRIAIIEDRLGDSLGPLVGVVLMRVATLDPRLFDTLHAAVDALDRAESAEQTAQAALSCRRFLGQLADVLSPASTASASERKVGPQQYRNRLWRYIEENVAGDCRPSVQAAYKELGDRLDSLDTLAQRHVHGPGGDRVEARRLIVKMTVWAHDVLTLKPLGLRADVSPHWLAFSRFAAALVAKHRKNIH